MSAMAMGWESGMAAAAAVMVGLGAKVASREAWSSTDGGDVGGEDAWEMGWRWRRRDGRWVAAGAAGRTPQP